MNAGHPPGPSTPRPDPRDLLENMSDAFVALDKDWRYTYVNRRAGELFGRRPEDLLGKHIWTEFPEGVGQPFHLAYEKAMADQQPARLEAYYPPYDRWFENIIYPSPDGLAIYFHDITDRKEAEEKLAASEARLRAIIDTEPECVKLLAADGSLLEMNPAGLRMLEADSFAQLENCCVYPLVVEEHRQGLKELTEKVFAGGSGALEFQIVGLKGGRRWLETHASPLRDAQGRITASLGITRDITARKEAENQLRERERRLSTLISNLPGAVFRARNDPNYTVEYISDQIAELTGYPADDFRANRRSFGELMHPDDREWVWTETQQALGEHRPYEVTYRFRDAHGRERWNWERGTGIYDANGELQAVEGFVQDITERKQAEEALRKSEARLRLVLDGLGSQMFVGLLDTAGVVLVANRPALEAAGLHVEDVLGYPVHETYWFTYSDAVAQRFRAAVQRATQGETVRYDEQIRVAEGRLIWVAFTVNPLRDESGKVVFLVPSAVVIEERKQAEAALRASHDRLKKVLEVETVGVMFWDLTTGCMTDANDTLLKIMGYSRREVEARELTWQKLTPPEYLEASLAEIRKFQATGRVGPYEKEYLRKDGTRQWFVFAGSSLGPDTCVEFCVDISDRKRAEATLRESEERLRQATEAAHLGTFDWDVPGNHITWSRRHEELWGFKPGEFGGTYEAFSQRVHPDDLPGINAEVARCIAAHAPWSREFRVVWPDGSVHWIMGQGEFTFFADGQPLRMRGVVKEITERKQAEHALRELTGRLLRLQDEERRRIARELHDTTAQNLAALSMGLAALKDDLPNADERTDQALATCLSLAEQSARELRTLSYLLHPPLLDDFGLARAAQDYAAGFSRRSGIRVDLDLPAAWQRLDRDHELALFRVLQESLSNVHRHSGSATVSVRLAETDEEARLEIQDAGCGLPGNAGSLEGVQAGVGILGMRERMQQLGGRLEIKSRLPGTLVQATLPRVTKGI